MLSAPPRRRISCPMSARTGFAVEGSPSTRFSIARGCPAAGAPRGAPGARIGPRRNQHRGSVGAAGRVGVLVGPHVHAAVAGALDEADRRGARAPVVLALGLQVRGDHPRAGLLADRRSSRSPRRAASAVPGRPGSARTTADRCPRCARARCRCPRPAAARARAPRPRRSCSSGPARTRVRPTDRPRLPAGPGAAARASALLLRPSMARRTSSFITCRRMVPCPTSSIAFTPMPCFSSSAR